MFDSLHHNPEESDIPWDHIQTRATLPISWTIEHECQQIRQAVQTIELANGLRYGRVINPQTGNETFLTRTEELLNRINGVDLGNGYSLRMLITNIHAEDGHPYSTSKVMKDANGKDGTRHHVEYSIDPHEKHISGHFDYMKGGYAAYVGFYTEYRSDKKKGNPKATMTVSVRLPGEDNDQANFFFNEAGELVEAQRLSMSLRDDPKAEWETLAPEEATQRAQLTWSTPEELTGFEVQTLILKFLQINSSDLLVLDTRKTMNNIFRNINTTPHKDPKTVLVFKSHTTKSTQPFPHLQ